MNFYFKVNGEACTGHEKLQMLQVILANIHSWEQAAWLIHSADLLSGLEERNWQLSRYEATFSNSSQTSPVAPPAGALPAASRNSVDLFLLLWLFAAVSPPTPSASPSCCFSTNPLTCFSPPPPTSVSRRRQPPRGAEVGEVPCNGRRLGGEFQVSFGWGGLTCAC